MQKMIKALAVVAMALAAGAAQAQSPATTTFQVSANVQAACTVSADNLAFGEYFPFSFSDLDGSTSISVTCTNGTGYTVDVGTTPTALKMQLTGGGQNDTLDFGLYRLADRSDTGFSATGTTSGTHTVYGRVPARQMGAKPGFYGATVMVSVTY
jgi:spore coat protein U-like protein